MVTANMKHATLMVLSIALIFGFIAFGNYYGYNGWGYSNFAFHGYPNFPAVSYHPTYVNFYASSGYAHYYAPVTYTPSTFRFVFMDP